MKFLFLGRQPVITSSQEIHSFFLRFNTGSLKQKLSEVNYMASISKILHSFDIKKSLGSQKGWLRIDCRSLLNMDISLLPHESFILYLLQSQFLNEEVYTKIDLLKEKGYEFVVEDEFADLVQTDKGLEYLKSFTAIVFDGRKEESFIEKVKYFNDAGVTCAIKNVATQSAYKSYKEEGFKLFLGHFMKEAQPIKGHQISSSKLKFLELLRMMKSDVDMSEIVAAIKVSPDISLQLLKYMNSANVTTTKHIENILDATTLLGRQKLTSWVILSLYSASDHDIPQDLIDTSIMRAHLMELICDLLGVPELEGQAFLVGLLSVSDAIFRVYLHVIIDSGNFSQKVNDALLHNKGNLAKILTIAKVIEEGNVNKLKHVSEKIKVPVEKFSLLLEEIYFYLGEAKKSYATL